MRIPFNGIFPFESPMSKDTPSLRIDRRSYCLEGRRCKKFLENQPTLVGEHKQPADQFEKPRLLPDIQQFEKFRDGVPSQRRKKPFGFVN